MAVRTPLDVYQGDTYLSPWWVVVVDGAGIDLADPVAGWTVKAQARHGDDVVLDFGTTPGARVLTSPWTGEVDGQPVETSALRLYLTPAATTALTANRPLSFDIELNNPAGGPLDDPYRVTLVVGAISVTKNVTE